MTATSPPDLSQIAAEQNLQVLSQVASTPTGYTPQQIQNAYGINQITFSDGTVVGNGKGQTVAIVDAYNDPNITSDLTKFDSEFGLSAPPSFKVNNLARPQPTRAGRWRHRSTSSGPTPWLPEPISFWSKLLRRAFPLCSMQSFTPAIKRASASSR